MPWLAALTLTLSACKEERWDVGEGLRARDAEVAEALGDTAYGSTAEINARDIPDLQPPRALRPCCAFGADLRVEVGRVPVPGVSLSNVIGPNQVGPHKYDNGFLTVNARDSRAVVTNENNGLVYTCRGGFIDTAHVRDNADLSLAIVAQINRNMEAGGSVELPPQGAEIRVRHEPISAEAIRRYNRRRLGLAISHWVTFQLSVWHEIATWYGYTSTASWPEKISAFSPEDLYSNAVGIKILSGIVLASGANSEDEYNRNMDAWLQATLRRLEAVPQDQGKAAMSAVDGVWWDSKSFIPDWRLVMRRELRIGPRIHPWLVREATFPEGHEGPTFDGCRDAGPALVLKVPDGFEGHRFRDHVTVEFEVGDGLAAAGFPFPRPDSRIVTQQDFPAIIEDVRKGQVAQFEEGSLQP